jgi:predicted permease
MKELWRRIRWFLHRTEFDSELEEEMRDHIARKAQESGMPRTAPRDFGNVTLLKERSRAMWTWRWVEELGQDLRHAFRAMAANKLFSGLAIVSLALGIGANTAIYSFLDAILLRALPIAHPEQLAILYWRGTPKQGPAVIHDHSGSSYTENGAEVSPNYPYQAYEFLRDANHSFSALFGYADARTLNLVIDGQAELGDGQYVSGNYFSGLNVAPAAGRLISSEDDNPGANPTVTISYAFWQKRFGGSSAVLGKTILVNGTPFTVTGISPPEFFGLRPQRVPAIFIPVQFAPLLTLDPYMNSRRLFKDEHAYWIEIAGRVKPGVTLSTAQTELAAKFERWVSATATTQKERSTLPKLWLLEGKSGMDALRREYSKALYTLMTMVVLILAIACANLANLLLARGAARRREIAVRLSLGAGRLRVIRQLLTESILLSLWGGALGVFVGLAGIRLLTLLLANGDPNFTLGAEMDWRVLAFSLAVTLGAALLFGITPAVQATKVDITPALKEARATSTVASVRRFGTTQILVVSQIAVSLVLVVAAGLFVRTLANLHAIDVGFNREKLLVFDLDATNAGYQDEKLLHFYAELWRRFENIPGVTNTTFTDMPLVADWTSTTNVSVPGSQTEGKNAGTARMRVGPRFFETLQIPILAGRALDEHDNSGAPKAAVVNEVFVKKYLGRLSVLGRHITIGGKETATDLVVVGVARTTRYSSLKQDPPPLIYTSTLQSVQNRYVRQVYFELRTHGDPLALASTVRGIVHEAGPEVPVADLTTESNIIEGTIAHERTFADLCTVFGALALLTACIGLYATQAYAVARRTSEIGIRMALGAERSRVLFMVMREVFLLSAMGVLIGLAAVWQTSNLLQSFLFGLKAHDVPTFVACAAILMVCVALAAYGPARRASHVDPMTALRHE